MDATNIKYNHELLNRKIELEKNLKGIKKEIERSQKSCNHIRVFFSLEGADIKPGDFKLEQCLFCGKQDLPDSYPLINASTYRRRFKKTFGEKETIEKNIRILQELCIVLLKQNPDLTEEELIDKVEQEIEKDNEANKKEEAYQKKLYSI
ncbi:MAG: hypothetical protein K2I72_01180 [Bacilli bacterium]|nr:hypothetical protein [Bacilli bacterium]